MKPLLIFIVFAQFISCNIQNKASKESASISNQELSQLIQKDKNFVLIDVRTPEEIVNGKILDGALEVDYKSDEFKSKISALDKKKSYVLYCRSGRRSMLARNVMIEMGFEDVLSLDGGITDWIQ